MLEIDLDLFQTECEDASLRARIVPSGRGPYHCIAIEGDHRDLILFMLTVAPVLDDHFETVGKGELDYRREWHNVSVVPCGLWSTISWPDIRPVRGLRMAGLARS